MPKPQPFHGHSHGRSLLTWRGVRSWCLGRRASGLCRFFIRIRTRPKLRLTLIFSRAKSCHPQAFFLKWLAHAEQVHGRTPRCCLPMVKQGGCIRCRNMTEQWQHVCAHSQQKSYEKDAVSHRQPHDTDVRSQKPFKRVDETHAKLQEMHECSTRLGSADSSIMSCLQRQSSSGEISFNSLSVSSSSSSASGSFQRVSGSTKLREACAKVVHGGPSICELVAGNQFLVHLSAAPIKATPLTNSSHGGLDTGVNTLKDKQLELSPSMGVPCLKHKESDINDRIVFFK